MKIILSRLMGLTTGSCWIVTLNVVLKTTVTTSTFLSSLEQHSRVVALLPRQASLKVMCSLGKLVLLLSTWILSARRQSSELSGPVQASKNIGGGGGGGDHEFFK